MKFVSRLICRWRGHYTIPETPAPTTWCWRCRTSVLTPGETS